MDSIPHDIGTDVPPESGHEESDASIRPLAMFLAGLSTSIIIVAVLVWLLFYVLLGNVETGSETHGTTAADAAGANQPQLQVSPRRDLEALREREDKVLESTEWIDRNQRIARIPIQSAIEVVAAHGLPKWPPAVGRAPTTSNPSSVEALDRMPPKQ